MMGLCTGQTPFTFGVDPDEGKITTFCLTFFNILRSAVFPPFHKFLTK